MITVSLRIVNTYEDGDVITTVITGAEVTAPPLLVTLAVGPKTPSTR